MKVTHSIKILTILILVSAAVFYAGTALAGFFVIPIPVDNSKNTVTVSPVGTDSENGTVLLAALAKITDASNSNPYLIVIEPGAYDVGDTPFKMKEYVDVTGWGEDLVTIQGSLEGYIDGSTASGVVWGADHSELRKVKVKHVGGVTNAVAVFNQNLTDTFLMTDVKAEAEASSGSASFGVYNDTSDTVMTRVTATATGIDTASCFGIFNFDVCAPTMNDVTAVGTGGIGNYGIFNNDSSPVMNNVTATAACESGCANQGVYSSGHNCAPVLKNVTASASGGLDNRGIYNGSGTYELTDVEASAVCDEGCSNSGIYNTSPTSITMTRVRTEASGGDINYGINNLTVHECELNDVTANVSTTGSGNNYGVHNSYSSPGMTRVTATATGGSGSVNYGVYNNTAQATMTYIAATASGGSESSGLYQEAGTLDLENSDISGDNSSVDATDLGAGSGVRYSRLDGTVSLSPGENVTCKCVCLENGTCYESACP